MKIETAKEVYKLCAPWYKTVLEDEFGKGNLINRDFSEIQTIEVALETTGYDASYLNTRDGETIDEWAYRILKMVTKAINGEWTADWSNTNQPKWYNYFRVLPSGAGFSLSRTDYSYGGTDVGSRLCFESQKKAEQAAKYFEDLYIKYLLITK